MSSELSTDQIDQIETFFDLVPQAAILLVNAQGNIRCWSQSFQQLTQYECSDLSQQSIFVLCPTDQVLRQEWPTDFSSFVSHDDPEFRIPIRLKDGNWLRAEVRVRPAPSSSLPDHYAVSITRVSETVPVSDPKAVDRPISPFVPPQLLEEVQAIADFGCFQWNISNDELTWSKAMFNIYGITPADFSGTADAFFQRVYPDDRVKVQQALQDARGRGGEFRCDERIVRPNGEIRYLESCGHLKMDQQGTPLQLVGVCQDVTARHQSEATLRAQIRGLELLAEFSAALFARDLPESQWSPLLSRLSDHLQCKIFAHFVFEGGQLRLTAHGGISDGSTEGQPNHVNACRQLCRLCTEKQSPLHLTFRELARNSTAQPMLSLGIRTFYCVPLVFSGQMLGTLAFASTERDCFSPLEIEFIKTIGHVVSAARAGGIAYNLRLAEEERYHRSAEHARMVIWEANPTTGDFTYVSGFYEELLGFPIQSWYQPSFWFTNMHPDDTKSVDEFYKSCIANQIGHRCEYRMIRADGEVVWIDDTVNVVVENGETVLLRGTFVEITERKSLEDQLLQSQKMEAVGRLAGGIAHDFNNLLTVINTSCDLLRIGGQTAATDLRKHEELLSSIQDAGQRAARLTNQLLLFSRSSMRMPENVDVNLVIKEVGKLLRRLLGEDISVATELSANIPKVRIDPTHLEQMIMNLAVNARDAMPDGGRLTLATKTIALPDGNPDRRGRSKRRKYVQLSVSDTGAGIDETTKKNLFDPFFTTKRVGLGTGLGLSVVYGIVSQAGGQIDVESEPNQGATFRICLPASSAEAGDQESSLTESNSYGAETILLVEDEEAVRQVAGEALRRCGYLVLEASNAADATALASAGGRDISLLITDVIMPQVTGPELAKALCRDIADLKVLYFSGYPGDAIERHGIEANADNFLQKPFTLRGLAKKVRSILDTPISGQAGRLQQ